ncbi:MAG: hypothetical protein EOO59_10000, partial [Hymenobacter sp.]
MYYSLSFFRTAFFTLLLLSTLARPGKAQIQYAKTVVASQYTDAAREVVSGWFLGTPSGQVPWGAWLIPLFVWGTAIAIMY